MDWALLEEHDEVKHERTQVSDSYSFRHSYLLQLTGSGVTEVNNGSIAFGYLALQPCAVPCGNLSYSLFSVNKRRMNAKTFPSTGS